MQDLAQAIRHRSPEDLAAFRAWRAAFEATVGDRHGAAEVAAGRFDPLAVAALQECQAGRCTGV